MIERIAQGAWLLLSLFLAAAWQPARAEENPEMRRLFDLDTSAKTNRSQLRNVPIAVPGSSRGTQHTLQFNGKLSSSDNRGIATSESSGLWINGYPFDGADLPVGVLSVKWYDARQVLVVELTNGSKRELSPGDSIVLKDY